LISEVHVRTMIHHMALFRSTVILARPGNKDDCGASVENCYPAN
jgi:hypothetical protein